VPLLSAKPGARLSVGLCVKRGEVSLVPLLFGDGLVCSGRVPTEPVLPETGLVSSIGYGRGDAELLAPGGSGKESLLLDGAG
jgi:hypothetical protein